MAPTPPNLKTLSPEPDGLEIAPGVRVPESAFRLQYSRSSGPGGQNVNKVNTKAEIWITVSEIRGLSERALARLRTMSGRRLTMGGELHLTAETERSLEGNKATVLERLRELILQARHEPKVRKKTKISRGAKQRRLQSKRHRGEIKAGRQGRSPE